MLLKIIILGFLIALVGWFSISYYKDKTTQEFLIFDKYLIEIPKSWTDLKITSPARESIKVGKDFTHSVTIIREPKNTRKIYFGQSPKINELKIEGRAVEKYEFPSFNDWVIETDEDNLTFQEDGSYSKQVTQMIQSLKNSR